jgi:KDO2-lipid IV(A) lauroyltransferase
MNSIKKLFLFVLVKILAFLFNILPIGLDLWIGRCCGRMAYGLLFKKRQVVYANLKTVFSATLSPSQIRGVTASVFMNFAQSVVELLCLPKIKRLGFEKYMQVNGKENIDQALAVGKGVILLAVHSGSWELGSVVGGIIRGSYHVVVNDQSKIPKLDKMLNEFRMIAGARVITTGMATKEIIKAMHQNEIVSLVLDQGGKTGLVVPFLGRTSSMSTGAMRLGLKYGCAVCPVWIERGRNGKHTLSIFPALSLTDTGDLEKDIHTNIVKAADHFEGLIRRHPAEYLWFYKVFKYSSQARTIIIDDGRTGHLRQSQSLAHQLREVLKKKGKTVEENTVSLQWKSSWASTMFSYYAFLTQYFSVLRMEDVLGFFVTKASFKELMKHKADYIISCGSQGAGVNYILSKNHLAKSISILSPGHISQRRFSAIVLPQHDKLQKLRHTSLITPKVSPSLINVAYLKEQREGLFKTFSHLRGNVRTKFGVLIGGDAKGVKFGEAQARQLMTQIKEAALHYKADILLTTSRRTPAAIEQIVAKELKGFDRCSLCIIANQRNVPEAIGGILDLSDLVIVSGESISMVSEALSSGKPTIVFSPNGRYGSKPRDKYEEFVLKLHDQGYLMATSIDGLKLKITQLLSRKITLQSLDDQNIIQKGLEVIV